MEDSKVRWLVGCLAALALSLVFVVQAHAQTTCPTFAATYGPFSSGDDSSVAAAVADLLAQMTASNPGYGSWAPDGANCSVVGASTCDIGTSAGGGTAAISSGPPGACPASCSSSGPTMDILSAIAGSSGGSGGSLCVNGCGYTNGGNTLIVGSGTNQLMGKAIPTGASCSTASGTGSTSGTTCMLSHGSTVCVADSSNQAIVNSDIIPITAPPPNGTCVSYASGGTMCTVSTTLPTPTTTPPPMPTPPGPDNGTAGTPATPTATVVQGSTAVNYYSPATTSNSSSPVSVGATGSGLPTGKSNGTGTGTGSSGTGSGNAGDCDQSASGGDASTCTGTLPSLTRTDTAAGDATGMFSAIQATPLFSAFGAVSTAFGSGGSCPSAPITLTYIHYSGDFMTSFCSAFAADLSTMIAISDAAWCLLGLFIIVSA